jgi:arginine decarboxylase-like protein
LKQKSYRPTSRFLLHCGTKRPIQNLPLLELGCVQLRFGFKNQRQSIFSAGKSGDRKLTTAIEQTLETYGIENWGAGYFDVNRKGNLIVRPAEGDTRSADLKEIIDDLARRGIGAPVLLRFPQLVAAQVAQSENLNTRARTCASIR